MLDALPRDADLKAKRKAIHDAYPWHERRMHPYKMWCKAARKLLKVPASTTQETGGLFVLNSGVPIAVLSGRPD